MTAQPPDTTEMLADAGLKPARELTREELAELFDRKARFYVAMTGDEFRQRWHAGQIPSPEDAHQREAVEALTKLLPLAEGDLSGTELCALVELARELSNAVFLTREEAIELFDHNARSYLGISGEEFKRRWEAGEYPDPDDPERHAPVMPVAMLLPLLDR